MDVACGLEVPLLLMSALACLTCTKQAETQGILQGSPTIVPTENQNSGFVLKNIATAVYIPNYFHITKPEVTKAATYLRSPERDDTWIKKELVSS